MFNIKNNVICIILSTVFLGIFVSLLMNFNFKNFDYNEEKYYPVKTTKYIKENLDYKNIRLYNDFNYGSYLAYNNIPIFIDSRAEVYMKQFNKKEDIMKNYIGTGEYVNYEFIFLLYDFDYALVYKDTDIYHFLSKKNNYKVVYEENNEYALIKIK